MPGEGRQSSGFNFSTGRNSCLKEQNPPLISLPGAFRIAFARIRGTEGSIPTHQSPVHQSPDEYPQRRPRRRCSHPIESPSSFRVRMNSK